MSSSRQLINTSFLILLLTACNTQYPETCPSSTPIGLLDAEEIASDDSLPFRFPLAGLRYRAFIYPTDELIRTFVPNDVVNLFVGLPILLGSMWLAWRGRLIGLLCWTGALFFVFYNYTAYVFAMPLNWAFLLHLALTTPSASALAGLVASIDGNAVRQRLSGAVHEKLAGGVLAGLGLLFLLRVIGVLVNAITSGTVLAETDLAVNIADFLTTPAWIIGGIPLWRRKAFGYVTGLGLLFQGSMLFVALIIFLLNDSKKVLRF